MFVTGTLEGTVVTVPDQRFTSRGVPVANFAVAAHAQGATAEEATTLGTTWVVAAYAELAAEVLEHVAVRDHVVISGTFAASDPYIGSDGVERARIEVRAQSVAVNPAPVVAPAVLTLRGTVATPPEVYTDQDGIRRVDLDVRTSRFKRGDAAAEADITYWPVTAERAELVDALTRWQVGQHVVVVGEARPLVDASPQVEILARSAGRDLYSQDNPPAARARTGRERTRRPRP